MGNQTKVMKVVLISGSLRKASTNTGLLRAAQKVGNPRLEFQWADISDFPMFNEDVEAKGVPESVARVANQIKGAHAILFAVPENNFSVSACLKNAYDWLSRGGTLLKGIPAAMVSSGGQSGGERGQTAFKIVGEYLNVQFLESPKILVKRYSGQYFNQTGDLIHQEVLSEIKAFLQAFANHIEKVRG